MRSDEPKSKREGEIRRQTRLKNKIEEFSEIIRLAPNNIAAYRERGHAYLEAGLYEKSIADYTAALQLDPKNRFAFEWRAFAHEYFGAFDPAITDYRSSLELDPSSKRVQEKISSLVEKRNKAANSMSQEPRHAKK